MSNNNKNILAERFLAITATIFFVQYIGLAKGLLVGIGLFIGSFVFAWVVTRIEQLIKH
jgi:hypothetical protein